MNNATKILSFNAIIAALYTAFTMLLSPISYGVIQLRFAESLAILPFALPFTVWGIFIGCALSNLISPFGIFDMILGSLVTLTAGLMTSKIKNIFLAPLPPILLNALGLPLVWFLSGAQDIYWFNVLSIFVSQSLVLYGLGIPLALFVGKVVTPKYFPDYLKKR